MDGTARLSKLPRVFIMAMSVGQAASGLCKCQVVTTCALQKADVTADGAADGRLRAQTTQGQCSACPDSAPRAASLAFGGGNRGWKVTRGHRQPDVARSAPSGRFSGPTPAPWRPQAQTGMVLKDFLTAVGTAITHGV